MNWSNLWKHWKKLKEYTNNPEYKTILENSVIGLEDKIKCSFSIIQKTLLKYYKISYKKLIDLINS